MKKRKRVYKKKDVKGWEKLYPEPKREKRTPHILFPFPAGFDRPIPGKKINSYEFDTIKLQVPIITDDSDPEKDHLL